MVKSEQNDVFEFIYPLSNDMLKEFNGVDLQELMVLINRYYLSLRSSLGISRDITFGLELEFENAWKKIIERKLEKLPLDGHWIIKDDLSLIKGAEINSPILRDNEVSWEDLEKVCLMVNPLAKCGKNCGGHIHIGTQTLGSKRESWLNLIKMWSVYENIIFRFSYGEFLTARPNIEEHARPVAKRFFELYQKLNDDKASLEAIITKISNRKDQAVSFMQVVPKRCDIEGGYNTIEFRCPNGTLNSVIWQNNVNFFVKLLSYCRSSSFDDDVIEERSSLVFDKYDNLRLYDQVFLDQALELCDMIFTNNLDKVYFLRQYLKSFQVCKKRSYYSKARTLTKK